MQLTEHQTQVLNNLISFANRDDCKVFILKGSAGTGKTTLLGHFINYIKSTNKKVVLLATTGRAAKILTDKTGRTASTIHSTIYSFDSVNGVDHENNDPWASATGQLFLDFGLKQTANIKEDLIYIVDESSMIGHEPAELNTANTARFGSGSLLDDLMAYVDRHKIVFTGDPCQLPPVSVNPFSAALSYSFIEEKYNCTVMQAELTQIMRQSKQSEVLAVADQFRQAIQVASYEKYPKIKLPERHDVFLYKSDTLLVQSYLNIAEENGLHNQIMLSNANWHVQKLNLEIRKGLGLRPQIQVGDILMIVQNSYNVNLMNGDQVKVLAVAPDKLVSGLQFIKVRVKLLHNDKVFETLLISDLLYNSNPGLTAIEAKNLLVDFDQRMRNRSIARNTEQYKKAMLDDIYLNALRAKFGYCITAHKSQGGEWKHVFLNIQKGLYALQGAFLYRWYYTAITRAAVPLHVNDGWWVEGYNYRPK